MFSRTLPMLPFLILLFAVLSSPTNVFGVELPLVLSAKPDGNESIEQALLQLKELRANGVERPATIVLAAGVYHLRETLQLTPELVGEGLTLKPQRQTPEGAVILSGGRPLGSASRDAQGNWRYRLPEDWKRRPAPRSMVIDHQMKTAARYPSDAYLRIERSLDDRRSGFVVAADDLPKGLDLSVGVCDLVFLHDWSSSRLRVASYESETRELRTLGPIGCAAEHYAIDHFEKQPRYWLEGHPSFADQAGEWFVDLKTEEVVVVSSGNVSSDNNENAPEVTLPWLTEILVASGTEEQPLRNLVVQGITFTETAFPMPAGGIATAQATMHEPRNAEGERTTPGRPMLCAAVKIERAEGCRVVDCNFRAIGGTGVWLAGRTRDCSLERCRIQQVGGNGINLGEDNSRRVAGQVWYQSVPEQVPTNNRVEDCEITACGEILPGSVGIWASLHHGLVIARNHVHHTPYTGISLGWIWNDTPSPAGKNAIRGNRIEFVMQILSDGGGIYTLGLQPGTVIEHNEISDVSPNAGRAESNGMFLDEGTTGFTICRNTIRRVNRSPLRFHKAGKNLVTENRWELATAETPPIRFNNTPSENITSKDNTTIED